ncbi:hypothetical protein EMIT0194MI4_60256 [Pseudomonas sp. IT-194MI4]
MTDCFKKMSYELSKIRYKAAIYFIGRGPQGLRSEAFS